MKGQVNYQALRPEPDYSAYNPIPVELPAAGAVAAVYEGAPNYPDMIGASPVGEDGSYSIELSKAPAADAIIAFFPLEFTTRGDFGLAVLVPENDEATYQRTREVWEWGSDLCPLTDCSTTTIQAPQFTITMLDGSGAMHIFEVLRRGLAHMRTTYPGVTPPTLAAFWDDKTQWKIKGLVTGSLFLGPNYGGATYAISPTDVEHWDASILIDGGLLHPSQWSDSIIAHEFGHYVMSSYSIVPSEGAPHSFDNVTSPGLAYWEGWPTFFGQSLLSLGAEPNPIYFWQDGATTHKMDLEQMTLDGVPVPLPNPTDSVDQPLSEAVVASTVWSLWAPSHAVSPQSLGDGPIFKALRHKRLLFGPSRGYPGPDLADFLDAVFCAGTPSDTVAAAANSVNYPWRVADAVCPL